MNNLAAEEKSQKTEFSHDKIRLLYEEALKRLGGRRSEEELKLKRNQKQAEARPDTVGNDDTNMPFQTQEEHDSDDNFLKAEFGVKEESNTSDDEQLYKEEDSWSKIEPEDEEGLCRYEKAYLESTEDMFKLEEELPSIMKNEEWQSNQKEEYKEEEDSQSQVDDATLEPAIIKKVVTGNVRPNIAINKPASRPHNDFSEPISKPKKEMKFPPLDTQRFRKYPIPSLREPVPLTIKDKIHHIESLKTTDPRNVPGLSAMYHVLDDTNLWQLNEQELQELIQMLVTTVKNSRE